MAGLEVAKFLAMAAPEEGPGFAVTLCEKYKFSSTCAASYGIDALGGVLTQVIANADVAGYDGQVSNTYSSSMLNSERRSPCS